VVRSQSQRNKRKTRKWTTAKRVQIRPKYSATVAFSWTEDKDGTNNNKQTNNKFELILKLIYQIFFIKIF